MKRIDLSSALTRSLERSCLAVKQAREQELKYLRELGVDEHAAVAKYNAPQST